MHALKERHINVDDMTSFPVMRLLSLTAMHSESQNFPWINFGLSNLISIRPTQCGHPAFILLFDFFSLICSFTHKYYFHLPTS